MFQSFRVTSVCQLVVRAADRRWSVAVRWRGDGAEHISGGIITQTAAASELQSAQWSRAAGSESALMTELSEDQFVWFLLKTFWTDLVEICPPEPTDLIFVVICFWDVVVEVKTASGSINTAEFLLESGFNQTTVAASPCAIVFMRNQWSSC